MVRDRDTTYVDNYVWLPLDKINASIIRGALMYGDMPSEAKFEGDHLRVPRYFIDDALLPQPVVYTARTWPSSPINTKSAPRDHQLEPLLSMSSAGHGVLNLGCGYGKTFISLMYIAARGYKAIVIVDKMNLLSQWRDEALRHLDIKPEEIGKVQGDTWKWETHKIVLASLGTLSRRARDGKLPEGFAESFGVAIYDECHHLSASVFAQTCPIFYGERHGLSATPSREDGMERVFLNHLGGVHYSKVDQALTPTCVFLQTAVSDDAVIEEDKARRKVERVVLDMAGEVNHRKLCAWLGTLPDRNALIVTLARELEEKGHHVLCLTHSVAHAAHMVTLYPGAGLASGDVPATERQGAIRDHRVSFGTVDIAAEALDVPSLSALIVMTPFGAKTHGNLLQQALGRIQRAHAGKPHPIAYFVDDTKVGMCVGLLRQVKRKLTEWRYPQEVINVRGESDRGVAQVQGLRELRLSRHAEQRRVRDGEPRS
ncbi:MAG: DEAD/DEAH box helicase [Candidatus Limnocylindrus sp.]